MHHPWDKKDKCCHCAMDKAESDKDILKKFKVVLPICTECKEKGLTVMKRIMQKDVSHV